MTLAPSELNEHARQEIQAYSRGEQSAEATGYNLRNRKLTLPGEPNRRAGDVIPEPSDEVVQAELKALDEHREKIPGAAENQVESFQKVSKQLGGAMRKKFFAVTY